jgi:hypothetical protein
MAINAVSTSTAQMARPQQQAEQAQPAAQAKRTQPKAEAQQPQQAQPVANTQGQMIGKLINTKA